MGFKAVKNNGGLMKAGDYECYLKSCGYSVTKNGNECIKFDFVVREDVEQEYRRSTSSRTSGPTVIPANMTQTRSGNMQMRLALSRAQILNLTI